MQAHFEKQHYLSAVQSQMERVAGEAANAAATIEHCNAQYKDLLMAAEGAESQVSTTQLHYMFDCVIAFCMLVAFKSPVVALLEWWPRKRQLLPSNAFNCVNSVCVVSYHF